MKIYKLTSPPLLSVSVEIIFLCVTLGMTKVIKGLLPHAGVGANFSPQMDYVGGSFQFVDCFRRGCLTMPWCVL
jgi:hypothetical protein